MTVVALLSWCATCGAASTDDPAPKPAPHQWSAITMFHGLPSREVSAIAQDADGILWFGTRGGLVRYDGQRLERSGHDGTSPAVRALALDPSGCLWVGTDAGAFVRGPQGNLPIPGTASHPIGAFLPVPGGRTWLASHDGIFFSVASSSATTNDVQAIGPTDSKLLNRGAESLPLTALALRGDGLLAGTLGRGLLTVRGGRVGEWPDPNRPYFVTALASLPDGQVLIGAETGSEGRGLFALDAERLRSLDIMTGPVTAITRDVRGDVWVGTRARGLFRVRAGRATERFTTETTGGGLLSNRVLATFVDRDGAVWVGTDRGVCRFDPHGPRHMPLGPTPAGNFVHALLRTADGRLWAGTHRGLFVRDDDEAPWHSLEGFTSRTVHAIAEGDAGRVLVGTADGLHVIDPITGSDHEGHRPIGTSGDDQSPARSVRAIRICDGSTYVAIYGLGIERLDGEVLSHVWPPADAAPAQREILSLSVIGGALWIGTAGAGAFIYTDGEAVPNADLGNLQPLWAVLPDGDKGVWAATGRGLLHLAGGGSETILPGLDFRALAADVGDAGSVWCATAQSGLVRVSLQPEVGVITARLGTDYGLPTDSLFALLAIRGPSGTGLVLGTNRGLAFYDPDRVPPSLRIERVVGRRPYNPTEWQGLHLDYPQDSIVVEAAAVGTRTFPEHFQYVFSLSRTDGRVLRSAKSRDGQFVASSLAPGAYRIEVRALGVDLVPSAPQTLVFDVARAPIPWPPIALGALLAAALGALGWGYGQNRRLVTANRALSETRLQLVQETENERSRIARDLHDQTLADLRRLLLITAGPGPDRAGPRDTLVAEAVEAISTEVRRICEDLSPSVLDTVGLTAALEWALGESLRHQGDGRACGGGFECADDVEDRLTLDGAARIQIYRIVQEVLANAVRHAHAAEIRLSVSLSREGELLVEIDDDGIGFDPSAVSVGRGLSNIRSRSSLIGAEVAWTRRRIGGTAFRLVKAGAARA